MHSGQQSVNTQTLRYCSSSTFFFWISNWRSVIWVLYVCSVAWFRCSCDCRLASSVWKEEEEQEERTKKEEEEEEKEEGEEEEREVRHLEEQTNHNKKGDNETNAGLWKTPS